MFINSAQGQDLSDTLADVVTEAPIAPPTSPEEQAIEEETKNKVDVLTSQILTSNESATAAVQLRKIETYELVNRPLNIEMEAGQPYILADIPLTCASADGCVLRSFGLILEKYPRTAGDTPAPLDIWLEYYQVGLPTIRSKVDIYLSSNTPFTQAGIPFFDNLPQITPQSQTSVRFVAKVSKYYIPGVHSLPVISSLTPRFGIGLNTQTPQAVPSAPIFNSISLDAGTKTYQLKMLVANRIDGQIIDPLDMYYVGYRQREIFSDVNMTTYKKVTSYGAASGSSIAVFDTIGDTATAKASFKFPKFGYFRSEFWGHDLVDALGAKSYKYLKYITYRAPTSVTSTVSSTTKKLTIRWVKPTRHTDGTLIDSSTFKGYMLFLRNAAGISVYYYKVEKGIATVSYTTPNQIPKGSYKAYVCGLSTTKSEGNCGVTATAVVVP